MLKNGFLHTSQWQTLQSTQLIIKCLYFFFYIIIIDNSHLLHEQSIIGFFTTTLTEGCHMPGKSWWWKHGQKQTQIPGWCIMQSSHCTFGESHGPMAVHYGNIPSVRLDRESHKPIVVYYGNFPSVRESHKPKMVYFGNVPSVRLIENPTNP